MKTLSLSVASLATLLAMAPSARAIESREALGMCLNNPHCHVARMDKNNIDLVVDHENGKKDYIVCPPAGAKGSCVGFIKALDPGKKVPHGSTVATGGGGHVTPTGGSGKPGSTVGGGGISTPGVAGIGAVKPTQANGGTGGGVIQ